MMGTVVCAIAEKSAEIIMDNAKKIAIAGAMAGAAAAGGAIVHAVDNVKFDKIIQKEKKISFEYGVKKGVEISEEDMQRIYFYPALAGISMAYYMARSDGSISSEEKAFSHN